jgi:hypothetical protein
MTILMILYFHFRTIFIAFVSRLKKISQFTCIKKLNHFKRQRIVFDKASRSMILIVDEKRYEIILWWLKNSENERLIAIKFRWIIVNLNQMLISMFFNISSFFFIFTNHDNNIRRIKTTTTSSLTTNKISRNTSIIYLSTVRLKNEYRSCRRRLSVETTSRDRSSLLHESIYKIVNNKCRKI